MAERLVGPLRHVYGVADKVLMMTLSSLLLGSGKPVWTDVGASMIAIDTLVHNFLHRTGILQRLGALHPYGSRLLQGQRLRRHHSPRSQASSTPASSTQRFPATFRGSCRTRFGGTAHKATLNMCNGNRIDDRQPCQNGQCRLYWQCDRKPLFERNNTRKSAK